MTDEDRRREPADDEDMADSFDIDETADENPARHRSADDAGRRRRST